MALEDRAYAVYRAEKASDQIPDSPLGTVLFTLPAIGVLIWCAQDVSWSSALVIFSIGVFLTGVLFALRARNWLRRHNGQDET